MLKAFRHALLRDLGGTSIFPLHSYVSTPKIGNKPVCCFKVQRSRKETVDKKKKEI